MPDFTIHLGDYARSLGAGYRGVNRIESQFEDFVRSLIPGWEARFEGKPTWVYTAAPGGPQLDVYFAVDLASAASALIRQGFGEVRLHDHGPAQFITCDCATHSRAA